MRKALLVLFEEAYAPALCPSITAGFGHEGAVGEGRPGTASNEEMYFAFVEVGSSSRP